MPEQEKSKRVRFNLKRELAQKLTARNADGKSVLSDELWLRHAILFAEVSGQKATQGWRQKKKTRRTAQQMQFDKKRKEGIPAIDIH
jgi:hypothetical protein